MEDQSKDYSIISFIYAALLLNCISQCASIGQNYLFIYLFLFWGIKLVQLARVFSVTQCSATCIVLMSLSLHAGRGKSSLLSQHAPLSFSG